MYRRLIYRHERARLWSSARMSHTRIATSFERLQYADSDSLSDLEFNSIGAWRSVCLCRGGAALHGVCLRRKTTIHQERYPMQTKRGEPISWVARTVQTHP